MSKVNTLCYNFLQIDSSSDFKISDDTPSPVRDVMQKENSAALKNYLGSQLRKYNSGGNAYPAELKATSISLESLLDDYCDRIKIKYPDDAVTRHKELIYWEKTTVTILRMLNKDNDYRIFFAQALTVLVRDRCLKKKTELYDIQRIQNMLDNDGLIEIARNPDSMTANAFAEYFTKMHNRQYLSIRRVLYEDEIYILRIGQVLNALKTISTNTRELNYNESSRRYFDANHTKLWEQVTLVEETLVNRKIRENIKKQQSVRRREPTVIPFEKFVSENYEIAAVSNELKKLLKGKRGKNLAKVMRAARDAGIITEARVPFSTLQKEFGVEGAQSGYYKYVNEGELLPEDYRYISEHLLNVFVR